jgi:transcription initiation factor TFIIIB Brf1 subunit/transcription initiation factor TFIIB
MSKINLEILKKLYCSACGSNKLAKTEKEEEMFCKKCGNVEELFLR